MFLAVRNNQLKLLTYLIDIGQANIHYVDFEHRSLVILATIFGYLEVVQYLIDRGVNINHSDGVRISFISFILC